MRTLAPCIASLALLQGALAFDTEGLQPISALGSFRAEKDGVLLQCRDGASVKLSFLAPGLVRVRTCFAGQKPSDGHSWAIAKSDWAPVKWSLREEDNAVVLSSEELVVRVKRDPLHIEFLDPSGRETVNADAQPMAYDPKKGRLASFKRLGLDEHFYGLGEKAAKLDRRRGRFVQWNSDTPGYVEGTDPIYQSVPFYIGLEKGRAYGLFYDNSHRSEFDFGFTGQDYAAFSAEGGELDYYYFAGPSMKKVLGLYTELTGRMPMQPLWALGNHQCRYSYYPDTMVEDIVRTYRAKDIPLDVMYLDIHYMNGYRSFTWDPARFPDPKGLMGRLLGQGVRVVTIVDPGVKYQVPVPDAPAVGAEPDRGPQDKRYYVFDQGLEKDYFLRRLDGSLYIGAVWPGKAVFVDYTKEDARRWWGELHRSFVDEGVAGFWNDMNEPSDFLDKSGATQTDVVFDDLGKRSLYAKNRNTFALNMARATYEGLQRLRPDSRPFVITRAGYAGIQRYATMWTGDNNATWDSLALNVPMFASLGLSGESFVGADVPGFIGRSDAELLCRAYQIASFVPLCRSHAACDSYDHEPWRFGARAEGIVRKYLKLRYALLPYFYTVLEEAHRTGVPFFRAPLLNFQNDTSLENLDDEFMVGDAFLAAPVLAPNLRQRDVYLPEGLWYDFHTGLALQGGQTHAVPAPLETMPLFVRGGSIVPSTEAMAHTGQKLWSPLKFAVYPAADGSAEGSLYEDDGHSQAYARGLSRRTRLSYRSAGGGAELLLAAPEGSHVTASRNFEITIHRAPDVGSVLLDGQALQRLQPDSAAVGWLRDGQGRLLLRLVDDSKAHRLELH